MLSCSRLLAGRRSLSTSLGIAHTISNDCSSTGVAIGEDKACLKHLGWVLVAIFPAYVLALAQDTVLGQRLVLVWALQESS